MRIGALPVIILAFGMTSARASSSVCLDAFEARNSRSRGLQAEIFARNLAERTRREDIKQNFKTGEFIAAIEKIARRDPDFARLASLFKENKFTFAMDRMPDVRDGILERGFLNIHQTQTSGGVENPGYRDFMDAEYTGLPLEVYKNLPPSLKPKSLYLIPETGAGLKLHPTMYARDIFGNPKKVKGDTWIFKLEEIKDRTLFLVGDSYNRAVFTEEVADNKLSHMISGADHFAHDRISQFFLPLEWLSMTIPFYYFQSRLGFWRYVDEFSPQYKRRVRGWPGIDIWQKEILDNSRPQFNAAFFREFPELKAFENDFLLRPYGNYTEGAHFGELPVNKVKSFIYYSEPPSEAQMKRFRELNIEVIDGRGASSSGAP